MSQSRRRQPNGKDLIIRMLAEVFRVRQSASGQARWQQISSSLVPVSLYSRTTSRWLDYLLAASSVAASDSASAMSPDSRDFLLLLQQFHQQTRSQPGTDTECLLEFQVIAHDYLEGQCRKILSVRIAQPGARIGRAGDHFVYWRESPVKLAANQTGWSPSLSCCQQEANLQTWGLNFASTNDAKLFNDICSLNLVDLDFNSDYLKHLITSDRLLSAATTRQQSSQQQQQLVELTSAKRIVREQRQRVQSFGQNGELIRSRQQQAVAKQRNLSRCPTCERELQLQARQQTDCPLHQHQHQHQQHPIRFRTRKQSSTASSVRARSRSSGRTPRREQQAANLNSDDSRARSFSTPASPEHKDPACPLHRHQPEMQQERAASSIRRQKEPLKRSSEGERPQKPARGLLRDSSAGKEAIPPPVPAHQNIAARNGEQRLIQLQDNNRTRVQRNDNESSPCVFGKLASGEKQVVAQDELSRFANSRNAQRRSTGIDISKMEHFNSISSRDARLARARYANSKNMKEFLSLDASHVLPTRVARRQQQPEMSGEISGRSNMADSSLPQDLAPASVLLNLEVDRTARQEEEEENTRHAATTTDDLPLDAQTRKRMLKLTSEEAISERTEPRSKSSTPSNERPTRAVSLGPELAGSSRARNARSDVGRRRSLERSVCVDLDSSVRGPNRVCNLSPLMQSASPLPPSNSSPSSREEALAVERRQWISATRELEPSPHCQVCSKNADRIASFKSAPDVSVAVPLGPTCHLSASSCHQQPLHWPTQCHAPDQETPARSSYAVALCHSDGGQTFGRQCHSCPNSLRRSRRRPQLGYRPFVEPTGDQPQLVDEFQMQTCGQSSLHEFAGGQARGAWRGGNLDHCAHNFNLASRGNKSNVQHQQLQWLHRRPCNLSAGAFDHRYNGEPAAPTQPLRPCSSLSSRSPLHFGLYESDCEEELAEADLSCPHQLHQLACCLNQQNQFPRSTSAHFEPTFRPVQGYDQTMARASLRSRQRARSQPPESEPNETFHLSKSMVNVEKLIKEVQHELDSLKRRPLCQLEPAPASLGDSPRKAASEENLQLLKGTTEDDLCPANKHGTSSTKRVGQFKCVGAIRKAGFLSVKKWILKRRQSIELGRKQGWKRYWVCLRGTALLFHSVMDTKDVSGANCTNLLSWIQANCAGQMQTLDSLLQEECEQQDQISREAILANMSHCYIEEEPRHLIIIEGAIAQPIPEHPKRDHVFCLSTTFGDAYLFQSGCQLESDNWISAIHNACAASIARDLNRDEATKLFQTKIRHLELETDKKLFLKHRLESRLTSMSSMSHINSVTDSSGHPIDTSESQEVRAKKTTLRTLLYKLHQQLLSLETYLEQVHCEIYQLRCYLSSCGMQSTFYQSVRSQGPNSSSPSFLSIDLPHPKSLLMHVSKSTKLLLIKLGVFTVSSFHAYIHARQGSAKSILQRIQQVSSLQSNTNSPLELRVRSHSISEALLAKSTRNVELQNDSEQLIHLSNLKAVTIRVAKKLFAKIRCTNEGAELPQTDSDDRYSMHEEDSYAVVNLKMHSSSNTMAIIKQVLGIINHDSNELAFLNYYLLLRVDDSTNLNRKQDESESKATDYVAKRRETLCDWSNFEYLELVEKIIFRLELTRARLDEDAAPFGISVNAQLFSSQTENLLNVYCSYIEWGSVADRVGLKDEDEFLAINGVPVMDLDMMFIECIIQDESKLRLVVRSSRAQTPSGATTLDGSTWRRDSNQDETSEEQRENRDSTFDAQRIGANFIGTSSQIISDEYISSLVCPPPPSHSNAFFRMDSSLVRQKSDMGPKATVEADNSKPLQVVRLETSRLSASTTIPSLACDDLVINQVEEKHLQTRQLSSADLADQLLKKTEQLTQLLGKSLVEPWNDSEKDLSPRIDSNAHLTASKPDSNAIERLKKSILELLETEFAYIRHLETINEHYMIPLDEISYLNIADLKHLSQIVCELSLFQKGFLRKLTEDISIECELTSLKQSDEFEELDKIVKQLDNFKVVDDYKPILYSLARTFLGEAEKFKIYASYCAAYSKLQKLLHPKRNRTSTSPLVTSGSHTLDVFLASSSMRFNKGSSSGHTSNHRDYLRPLSSFMNTTSESDAQLKQLGEFLGNLDSSSSSVSLSLSKSSMSDSNVADQKRAQKGGQCTGARFQRSIHQENFESYLIKPIQRIVKYPMLLNSIAVTSQVCEEKDVSNGLQTAVKRMEAIASHVNDTQRIHDEYGLIFQQIERQFMDLQASEQLKSNTLTPTGPHQPPISLSVDQLLYSGPVDWLNINEFTSKVKKGMHLIHTLFVFNSCVVFISRERVKQSKKEQPISAGTNNTLENIFPKTSADQKEIIRYQSLIPVSEVQVRSVPSLIEQSTSPDRFQWELFRCSSVNSNSSLLTKSRKRNTGGNVYLLSCSSNEIRNTFLRRIRYIIRESVRNMSLPLLRSPSSKSVTPKKLSSPSSGPNTNSSCSQSTSLSPVCNSRNDSKNIKDNIECRFKSQVEEKFTTTIQVNN